MKHPNIIVDIQLARRLAYLVYGVFFLLSFLGLGISMQLVFPAAVGLLPWIALGSLTTFMVGMAGLLRTS
jgi:hypothetical protein